MARSVRLWLVLPGVAAVLFLTSPTPVRSNALQPAGAGEPLATEDLKPLLMNMGFEPEELKNKEGKVTGYRIRETRDGFGHVITIDVSGSKLWVWLTSWLTRPKEPDGIPQPVLRKMLEHNNAAGLPVFAVDDSDGQPKLSTPMLNKGGVNAATLRRVLDIHMSGVKNTQKIWDPVNWDVVKKAPAKPKTVDPNEP